MQIFHFFPNFHAKIGINVATIKEINNIDYDTKFIFDDDAISLLMEYLHIDEGLADKFRRNISKDSWEKEEKDKYLELTEKLSIKKREELENQLKNLRHYSFCKSHFFLTERTRKF